MKRKVRFSRFSFALRSVCIIFAHQNKHLKENGKYINLDEKLFLGLINNESLKQYRKKTQIFRHATKEAIAERSKIDDIQKEFLVNFGRTVCITIFQYLQEN